MPIASPGKIYNIVSNIGSSVSNMYRPVITNALLEALRMLRVYACSDRTIQRRTFMMNSLVAVRKDELAGGSIVQERIGVTVADATGCKLPPPLCMDTGDTIIVTANMISIYPPEDGVTVKVCFPYI